MQKYLICEANKRVFLYPENWIDPSLRDDKSPVSREFEAGTTPYPLSPCLEVTDRTDLLQRDLNPQSIQDAIRNYLFKVDEVANLQALSLYIDDATQGIHILSRTRGAPFFYYYWSYNQREKSWKPWEKMGVDIPNYEVDNSIYHGALLVPAVWKRRLIVFIPQFHKQIAADSRNADETFEDIRREEHWKIQLGWSEYRNGKWTPKKLSPRAIIQPFRYNLQDICNYKFLLDTLDDNNIHILVYQGQYFVGRFEFHAGQLQSGAQ